MTEIKNKNEINKNEKFRKALNFFRGNKFNRVYFLYHFLLTLNNISFIIITIDRYTHHFNLLLTFLPSLEANASVYNCVFVKL